MSCLHLILLLLIDQCLGVPLFNLRFTQNNDGIEPGMLFINGESSSSRIETHINRPIIFGHTPIINSTPINKTIEAVPALQFPINLTNSGQKENIFAFPTFGPPKNQSDNGGLTGISIRDDSNCSIEMGLFVYEGNCERILGKSVCKENEWLVVNDNNIAECKSRPCPFGELLFKDRCVKVDNNDECSTGQILFTNLKGEAECDCEPSFHYMPFSGKCIPEHERGHCQFGKYIEVSEETGQVSCVHNPCKVDNYVYNPKTRNCHVKKHIGRCKTRLHFDLEDLTVDCISVEGHNIFEVPTLRCSSGSKRDYLQRCRASFRIPTQHSRSALYGRCPSGYAKSRNGSCRKTVSLFRG